MKKIVIFTMLLLGAWGVKAQYASFTVDSRFGCAPFVVTFTDKSSGTPVAWSWDFGDGSPVSTTQNPVKTYYNSGVYSVKLTVTYGDGSSKDTTFKNYITVSAGPQISFTASPDSVCPGELVYFKETISNPGIVQSILWDFKDGGLSTSSNPSYAYANSGLYRPVLRVTDTLGCTSVDSVSQSVYVYPKPKANFTASDSIFCIKSASDIKAVTFTNTSSSDAVGFKWFFDNGDSSTTKDPTESFNWGDYDIMLIATSANGCHDTLVKHGYVSVNLFSATFNVTDTIVCKVPGTTTFTGIGGTNYRWAVYQNGTIVDETLGGTFTPEFPKSGKYDVRLISTSQLGCTDTVYYTDYIWVYDEIKPEIVIRDTDHCNPNAAIQFINKTVYDSADNLGHGSTIWNFGDGSNLGGDSVTHSYGALGSWVATAYITTPYGCRLPDYKQQIDIYAIRTVGTMVDPAPPMPPGGCVPHSIIVGSIDDSLITSSPITNYTWLWGDGDSNDTKMVNMGNHTYTDTGKFMVYLQITNEQGCIYNVFIQVIPVGMPPLNVWKIPDEGDTLCVNDFNITVQAMDSMCLDSIIRGGVLVGWDTVPCAGVYATDWQWINNATGMPVATGKNASLSGKSFGASGPVSFSLSPSHNSCTGSGPTISNFGYICPGVAIIKYPTPNPMTQQDPYYCDYPTITCIDGSDGPTSWLWHFGNDTTSVNGVYWEGDTSTQQNPTYEYKPGSYITDWRKNGAITIRLMIECLDSVNNPCIYCVDSTTQMIYISHADMKLRATSLDSTTVHEICENEGLLFWDSTFCTTSLSTWGIHIYDKTRNEEVRPQSNFNPFTWNIDSVSQPWNPHLVNHPHAYKHFFDKYGYYDVILIDTDAYGCGTGAVYVGLADTDWPDGTQFEARTDTIHLTVHPRSIPNVVVPPSACAGDSVQFFDASFTADPFSSYQITDYLWNSGGKTDTAKNPYMVYATGGVFDVSLTVTNEMGCDSTAIFRRKINVTSTSASWVLASGAYEACNKAQVTFLSKVQTYPQSSNLSYAWEFNNGQKLWYTPRRAYTRNAIASFNVDSTMYVQITLVVTDTVTGCVSTYTDSILIHKPIAKFSSTDHMAACPELQVNYTDESYVSSSYGNTSITKWEWFFMDKKDTTYSTLQNPIKIYTYAGEYDAALVVTDDYNCTDTSWKKDYVIVKGPYGEFTIDTLSGCSPFKVQFKFNVEDVDTLLLITGDGSTRQLTRGAQFQMPIQYTYQSAGRYIPVIQLIRWVTDINGTKIKCVRTFVSEDTIWVIDMNPWFEIKDLYCKGVPITFINVTDTLHGNLKPTDMGSVDSVYWSFGNNTYDSTHFNGQTQYDSAGTYNVTLWAKAKTCNKANTRQIKVMEFPDMIFTHGDTSNCIALDVEFTAENLNGEEKQFDWVFEDGESGTGNPYTRNFTTSGEYPFSVTVTFSPDNCVYVYKDTVYINAWTPPTADFEIKDDEGNVLTDAVLGIAARKDAHFNDLTQTGDGTLVEWKWFWGDDDSTVINTGISGNTIHAYTTTSGYVEVTLRVEDQYGCFDTARHQILILESLKFPNIFSPNNDGINDVFSPTEDGGYFLFMEMIIYNRWGERVWRRSCENVEGGTKDCPNYSDPDFWWNGKNGMGADVSEGVYYWVLKARPLSESGDMILNGTVTLVR